MCIGWLSEYSLWYLGCLQGVFCRFTLEGVWDAWHPSMTLSALILSAPSSSGVLGYPAPGKSPPALQVHTAALPVSPTGRPWSADIPAWRCFPPSLRVALAGWAPQNPPAAAPRCCLGTAGSFGPCSQAQGLCTLTLDAPHSPKLALEYITGGKATLELLVCDGLFSSVKSLQVLKSI